MNAAATVGALVRFQLRRHRWLFLGTLLLLMAHDFAFLFVFQFWKDNLELSDMVLSLIPGRIKEGMGIPLTDLTDPRTYKALIFMRPDLRALLLVFGITLGTDVIAGEVGRGTADVLYSHPVRRVHAIVAGFLACALHLVCAGLVMLVGFKFAARVFPMGPEEPALRELAPAVLNIVVASGAIVMLAFLLGSLSRTRGRAVAGTLLLILVPMVLDFLGVFTESIAWFARLFPEHYYRPHLILMGTGPSQTSLLLASATIGAAAGIAAVWFASRRDLA
ncbi:MAG: ABC transporter permease [Planctomycetota bacterium]|nr:ABC transporter permease [Planctomycetota bacterium]